MRAHAWQSRVGAVSGFLVVVLCLCLPAQAQEAGVVTGQAAEASTAALPQLDDIRIALDTVWVLMAAFLVFFMHLGFAMLEAGFCRAKNVVAILTKNVIVVAVSSLAFLALGFGLMFGEGNGFWGTSGFLNLFVSGIDNSPYTGDSYQGIYGSLDWSGIPLWAKFFFQMVFAATAATIVSGAVAERVRFGAFYVFAVVLVSLFYPITGHWVWGGGWLGGYGMWDFAGSTVVHSVGGWAALAGAVVLGPRLGKYGLDGRIHPIPGHSLALATLGTLVLWFGWFGFNPGSTMGADWKLIGHIAATTNTAGAAGAFSASLTAWILLGKPDLTMILNGALAGLVAVTAPCAFISVFPSSLVIGLVGGFLVVVSVLFFDRIRIDDPVGAISVHLVNGIWGTLAVGLFAEDWVSPGTTGNGLFFGGGGALLGAQVVGVLAVGAFTLAGSFITWGIINSIVRVRVGADEESEGLDTAEHGLRAYPDFLIAAAD